MLDKEKTEVRKYIRNLKNKYSLLKKKQKSEIILKRVEKTDFFSDSKTIMVYWSMDDEVFTHDFIIKWYKEKTIILPVVKGSDLELKIFTGISNMTKGESFGINEPTGEIFNKPGKIDLIIVPGIAFDNKNNRLGRGKAYYDKLLKTTTAIKNRCMF